MWIRLPIMDFEQNSRRKCAVMASDKPRMVEEKSIPTMTAIVEPEKHAGLLSDVGLALMTMGFIYAIVDTILEQAGF